jgi:hypothetical protein
MHNAGINLKEGFMMTEKNCITRRDVIAIAVCVGLLVFLAGATRVRGGRRERARRIVCQANLQQIGKVAYAFGADHEDTLWPQYAYTEDRPRQNAIPYYLRVDVHDLLQDSYGMQDGTWVCPSLLLDWAGILNEQGEIRWYPVSNWPERYLIGYVNLPDLHDFYKGIFNYT